MYMNPVQSSNLVAVGYDADTETLRITFHNGTYDYFGVPLSVYQGLMNAPSHGSYHARYIKDVYRYQRIH